MNPGLPCIPLLTGLALIVAFPPSVIAQGLSPEQSVQRMKLPEGFKAQVIASEPLVRQPVAIEFDDRGRLWVIQYLQYPNPAGLKRIAVDRFSRTKYDRIPEPPPHGPRGADRITILEDTDGNGQMDQSHDFVEGLNLATGIAFGHGGVYVLNVPYLLFYPDRDRNDVPDTEPEVLLSGFGMEDAHSVANSLTWGPDGWLYGCQGSTVTANIRGIEFQQGVWRYHPQRREFELFCEGGGNAWGLDFDRTGRLFYSTNYGGHTLVHGVQGGYYIKSFGKHGALHNPHAYGYFEHAPHRNFRGGHVTVGGIVYQGDSFPLAFRDKYIAGDLLGHAVYWHEITPLSSTVQTAHAGELLIANDYWFAPTDVTLGPDGAVYVSDWHDARTAHPDPDAEWDRSNGRIVRIAFQGTTPPPPFDLTKLSPDELWRLHAHRNQWFVRRARQELSRRWNESIRQQQPVAEELMTVRQISRQESLTSDSEVAALEGLWTCNQLGGIDEATAAKWLESPHPAVRAWTIRLLGDGRALTKAFADRLDDLAEQEPSQEVRQQLAASASRFPPHQAMPVINANINRDLDVDRADPFLPLLWWWAVEKHSVTGREEVLRRFVRPTLWKSQLGRDVLLPRLIRRYAAEATAEGLDAIVRLLNAAPTDSTRSLLWPPILVGWQEQVRSTNRETWLQSAREHPFSRQLLEAWHAAPNDMTLLSLGIALRHPEPLSSARRHAFSQEIEANRRVELLERLGSAIDSDSLTSALELVESNQPVSIRSAALRLIARFDDADVTERLMVLHQSSLSDTLKAQIRSVLLARPSSALAWLKRIDAGRIPVSSTSFEEVRGVAVHGNAQLDALVAKHWGRLQSATREEKLAEIRRLNNDLRASRGDALAGQALFKKHCAACHQLFGEGARIGPDLTTANRQDRDFLLVSLVDPGSVIRKEFVSVVVQTSNGRVLTGLPIVRTDASITLVDSKGERQSIAVAEIEEVHESPLSLMPENLYLQLRPQELRDLFAYLQSK